jgi:hypothetical protein
VCRGTATPGLSADEVAAVKAWLVASAQRLQALETSASRTTRALG